MKAISFFLVLLGGFCFAGSLQAKIEVENKSPDGNFGLLNDYARVPPYDGNSDIVDARTGKKVLILDSDRQCCWKKLVWSKDSQWVAYFNDGEPVGSTRIFCRNGSSFEEIKLPELPAPKLPEKVEPRGPDAEKRARLEPIRWTDSGDLVLESELQDENLGRSALEITLGFDQEHRPTIRKAEPESASIVDYFLLLPKAEFEGPPIGWLQVIRSGNGKIDKKNGYMSCGGDGAQPEFDIALFRHRDGRPLLAISSGQLEGEDSVYLSFFELGPDGKMQRNSRPILPLTIKNDPESGYSKDGWKFDLPREGKTIVVRNQSGNILHKISWDGETFVEQK